MNMGRHVLWNGDALSGDIRQVFDRFLQLEDAHPSGAPGQWTPRVDIREDQQQFVIQADIPGIDPSQIEVNMDKGVLTIKGERDSGNTGHDGKFTRVERSRGPFHRRFALPDTADAEGITAHGKLGVLEIVIPKKAQATPRRITINAAY
jgi:HSP20 family protein